MRTRTFLFWGTRFDPQQEGKLTRSHLGSEEGGSVWGELKGRNQAAKMLETKWGDAEGRGRLGGQAVGEGGQLGGWRGVVGSQQPQGGAFTQAQLALLPCQPQVAAVTSSGSQPGNWLKKAGPSGRGPVASRCPAELRARSSLPASKPKTSVLTPTVLQKVTFWCLICGPARVRCLCSWRQCLGQCLGTFVSPS